VLPELAARNLLVKDPDGNISRQVMIKGLTTTRARYVCIKGLAAKNSKLKFKAKSKMARSATLGATCCCTQALLRCLELPISHYPGVTPSSICFPGNTPTKS
jgi:hypothetical protein